MSSRINHQEMRLNDAQTKMMFLAVIKRAKSKFTFRLENLTLMGNHFHLIIKPVDKESLSKIMQWILSVFTMAYNKIHHLSGHLWSGRFFSRALLSLQSIVQVSDYIDDNPVSASLVQYRWEWQDGGLHMRRCCHRHILDPLEADLDLLLPAHRRLMLTDR